MPKVAAPMQRPAQSMSRLLIAVTAAIAPCAAQVAWSQVTTNPGPAAHSGHAWDSARQRLVVFGGVSGIVEVGSTQEWNGSNWTTLAPGVAPAARSRPAMAFDAARGVTVLHGGGTAFYDDTWVWNGTTWFQHSPAHVPPTRFAAAMCFDPQRQYVVMFGGFDAAGIDLADVWEWDGNDWAQRVWSGPGPLARGAHRMAYDTARSKVLMCGGYSTPGQVSLADAWTWNGVSWTSEQALPNSVCDHLLVYDPTRACVVLSGGIRIQGSALTDLSDTYEWYGSWLPRATTATLPARNGAAGGFDASLGKIICSGGTNSSGVSLQDTWRYSPVSPAVAATYGAPCTWSPGPLLLTPVTLPYIGLPLKVKMSQASSTAVLGLVVLGTSATNWLGVPLPADLTTVGAPGCRLLASMDLLEILPISGGGGVLSWPLPVQPSAVGAQMFVQGATLDPGAPVPLLVDMSAAVAFVIGSP